MRHPPPKKTAKISLSRDKSINKSDSEMFHMVALSESYFTKTVINMLTD